MTRFALKALYQAAEWLTLQGLNEAAGAAVKGRSVVASCLRGSRVFRSPTLETGGFPMAEISPLRRRMIEDMRVCNLSPATQQSCLNAVSKFSRHLGRSPDRLGLEDVHAFQVHLVASGISWPALNQIVCALRFFYGGNARPGHGAGAHRLRA